MQTVTLGSTGIKISKMGMGVWQASSEWGGDDEKMVQAVETSRELGVTLMDTAELYGGGHSEVVLGNAIRKVGRENLVIATKVASAHLRPEELQKACRASIKRLGVKEIDLYQIHWPDPWEQIPLKHTMRAMENLYNEGKIRAIGVSNFAVRDLVEASSYLSKTEIVSNQVRYNLLQREIEEEVLPYCRKNGITILAWSPIAQGALSGKYGPNNAPDEAARKQNPVFWKQNLVEAAKVVAVLKKIGAKHDKTPTQVALNWLARKEIVVPIPGAKNIEQAEQNAGSVGWEMNGDELKAIDLAAKKLKLDYFMS